MILRLVWRSLARRPGRSVLLLGGYALGVGVTIALLSIGDALVEQSRDRELLGGGDLLVLPEGIDLETLRTGGVSSLYFGIAPASFFYQSVLSSDRFAPTVTATAPWIDDELLALEVGGTRTPVSAGGEIPSLADALGAAPDLLAGAWADVPADGSWSAPGDSALRAGIDAFHRPSGPAARDTSWAEWHYFNVVAPDGSWWMYLTWLVGGALDGSDWGGGLLATVVRADGTERKFALRVPATEVLFHVDRPDLRLGDASVVLDSGGAYRLHATVPAADGRGDSLTLALRVEPEPGRWLPPVDVSPGGFPSGYVVAALDGRARGRACSGGGCRALREAPAYHDHNWGTWADVTWDWGHGRAGDLSFLYGGVRRREDGPDGRRSARGGRFLFAIDSLGLRAVLPVRSIDYQAGANGVPAGFTLRAARDADSLRLDVDVVQARVSGRGGAAVAEAAAEGDRFVQMRGTVRAAGRLLGAGVDAGGDGFFETWIEEGGEPR